jgi:hypothetical protein
MTAGIAIAGALVAWSSDSVIQLLQLAGVFSIGMALIPALRWFWWRMTPWGEFIGFVTSVICVIFFVGLKGGDAWVAAWLPLYGTDGNLLSFGSDWNYYGLRILFVMIPTTLAAIAASLLSQQTSDDQLRLFVAKLRPPRFAWSGVAKRLGIEYQAGEPIWWILAGWVSMTLCIAGMLYGLGWLFLGETTAATIAIGVFVISFVLCLRLSGREAN